MIISYLTSNFYCNDRLFSTHGDLEFFYELRKTLIKKNIFSHTYDLITGVPDAEICLDNFKPTHKKALSVLILLESKAVFPNLYKKEHIKLYDIVFTYDDFLINNKNIFKLNYSYYLKPEDDTIKYDHKKFICNISSNKYSNYKTELYSERIRVIKFFEKNYPDSFDLFGFDWNEFIDNTFIYRLRKKASNIKLLRRIFKVILYFFGFFFYKKLKVYKGTIKNKYEVLKTYKFSICFENYYNDDGYVTEKIFDCFKCNVIPIYYGYSKIHKKIPKNTFIDYRKFKSNNELYDYLLNISPRDYSNYIKNARKYLNSNLSKEFEVTNNAKMVSTKIYERLIRKV